MLGISTVYFIDSCRSWSLLLERAKKLGFDKFELSVEIPHTWLSDIKNSVDKKEVQILSIHNYCPRVEKIPPGRTIFSSYLISSEDETERRFAIELTKKSILTAKKVDASTVIIHAGEVVIKPSGRDLSRFVQDFGVKTKLYQNYLEELRKNRKLSSERYLLNTIKSLREIANFAMDNNIKIGLENRFFYHEIPLLEEFGIIFSEIDLANIGFWYDVGHAEIFIRMGFMESHKQLLEPYKNKIIGFHLHDVRGMQDHYAPGEGELDFKQFFPYLSVETLKIIEAHPYSCSEVLKSSLNIFQL